MRKISESLSKEDALKYLTPFGEYQDCQIPKLVYENKLQIGTYEVQRHGNTKVFGPFYFLTKDLRKQYNIGAKVIFGKPVPIE